MELDNIQGVDSLSVAEMKEVNGGWIAFAGLLIAAFALGYEIGKSAAERARQ